MQRIPEILTTEILENLIDENLSNNEMFIDIVPVSAYGPGLFLRLLQHIATRLRNCEKIVISLYIDERDEHFILSNFYQYYQVLAIILLGKDMPNVQFFNKNGSAINHSRLSSQCIVRLNLQEQLYSLTFENGDLTDAPKNQLQELRQALFSDRGDEKERHGLTMFIPNFDHIPALNGTSYFYSADKSLRSKKEIISWITKVFRYNRLKLREGLYRNETHNDIGILIKELFDNTDEWARTTFDDSNEYQKNLRGCYINILMENRVKLQLRANTDTVTDYISRLTNTLPHELGIPSWQSELYPDTKIGLCEISMIDVGPGMARRWLQKDYNKIGGNEEIAAVINCFNKYVTSDRSGRYEVRGRGLNNVIKVIGNNGFLSVRSGHVSLFRNFLQDRLRQEEVDGAGLSFKAEVKGLVEGTVVTILYPFLYRNE